MVVIFASHGNGARKVIGCARVIVARLRKNPMTKAQVVRALQVLRVLDENQNLSLTNIALAAVLTRTLMIPSLTVHDLASFIAVVIGYQVKRFAQPVGAPEDANALKTAVEELQTKVTALQLNGQIRR